MADERGVAPAEPNYSNDAEMTDRLESMLRESGADPDDTPAPKAKREDRGAQDATEEEDDDQAGVSDDADDDSADDEESEADDQDDDDSGADDDDADTEASGDPNVADETDFEYKGKTYKIPRPLVEGAMRRDHFTRLTQETAEHRNYIAQQAEALKADLSFVKEVAPMEMRAQNIEQQITDLTAQLPQYAGNRDDYLQLDKLIGELKAEHAHIVSQAQAKRTELEGTKREAFNRLVQEGDKILSRAIPGWGQQKYAAILSHAQTLGYAPEELRNAIDPRFINLLHKSMVAEQRTKSTPATKRKLKAAAPIVRPGASAGRAGNESARTAEIVKKARKSGNPAAAEDALVALMRSSNKRKR